MHIYISLNFKFSEITSRSLYFLIEEKDSLGII